MKFVRYKLMDDAGQNARTKGGVGPNYVPETKIHAGKKIYAIGLPIVMLRNISLACAVLRGGESIQGGLREREVA